MLGRIKKISNFKFPISKQMRVGVLMGGMSTERDISLKSGQAVFDALFEKGYNVVKIDVGKDSCENITREKIDIAFISLHGKYGEDGAIQGLLEMLGIPYTGSDILSSAISINKVLSKRIFKLNKIPTPAFKVFTKDCIVQGKRLKYLCKGLGPLLIVKPNSQGSTIGVSLVSSVSNTTDLAEAVKLALKYDNTVLIEKFIKGRELAVGVLNNRALPVIEIKPKHKIYDYEAKYTKGMTEYITPAKLTNALQKKVSDMALKAFNILGCSGASRVDIMLDMKNRPYVLEVNTIPGMTETSLLPKAALCAGISFSELVEEILNTAGNNKIQKGADLSFCCS